MSAAKRPRLPKPLAEALDAADPNWTVEPGTRHWKLKVHGRLAAIWPFNGGSDRSPNGLQNIVACVRRAGQGVTSR